MGGINGLLMSVTGVPPSTITGAELVVANQQNFAFELRGVLNVAGTLDGKIQDSFDGGTTWQDWVTFAQLSASGSEVKAPVRPAGGRIRAEATVAVALSDWDIDIRMTSDPI